MSETNDSIILRDRLAKKVQEELEILRVEVGLDLDTLETYGNSLEMKKYLDLFDSFVSQSRFFHLPGTKGIPRRNVAERIIKKLERRVYKDIQEIVDAQEAEKYLKKMRELVYYYRPIIGTMYREFADSKVGNLDPIPEPTPETGLAYERFVMRSVEGILEEEPVSFSPEDIDPRYPQQASDILDRYTAHFKISRQELENGEICYL